MHIWWSGILSWVNLGRWRRYVGLCHNGSWWRWQHSCGCYTLAVSWHLVAIGIHALDIAVAIPALCFPAIDLARTGACAVPTSSPLAGPIAAPAPAWPKRINRITRCPEQCGILSGERPSKLALVVLSTANGPHSRSFTFPKGWVKWNLTDWR